MFDFNSLNFTEDDGRYVITHSASNSYCMHIKTGSDIKSTPIYPTVDGKYMMGSQSHESLTHCIDSKGKSYPNLSPVKRKNVSEFQALFLAEFLALFSYSDYFLLNVIY